LPGEEKSEILAKNLAPIIAELKIMCDPSFRIVHPITKKTWKFVLHFSSDVKFLEAMLGLGDIIL
jgi:hypothetical protein